MARHGKMINADAPLLLALETSGMCGSVALVGDGYCVGEFSLQTKVTHSRRLLSAVDSLLAQAECDWDGIGGIAVSLGPGSFTGIRIGLSTAKGMAMATGKPLVGVSTLDAMAVQLAHLDKPLCVVLDARKKEVYAAFYQCLGDGSVQRSGEQMVVAPEKLAALITQPTVMVGDGADLYAETFRQLLADKALLVNGFCHFPRAAAVGKAGWPDFLSQSFLAPGSAVPLYIRASDAELNFTPPV